MEYYSIGKFAKLINKHIENLQDWDGKRTLKPAYMPPEKYRMYNKELLKDLIQIVTVFSCKLQEKSANEAKKLIQELKEND